MEFKYSVGYNACCESTIMLSRDKHSNVSPEKVARFLNYDLTYKRFNFKLYLVKLKLQGRLYNLILYL